MSDEWIKKRLNSRRRSSFSGFTSTLGTVKEKKFEQDNTPHHERAFSGGSSSGGSILLTSTSSSSDSISLAPPATPDMGPPVRRRQRRSSFSVALLHAALGDGANDGHDSGSGGGGVTESEHDDKSESVRSENEESMSSSPVASRGSGNGGGSGGAAAAAAGGSPSTISGPSPVGSTEKVITSPTLRLNVRRQSLVLASQMAEPQPASVPVPTRAITRRHSLHAYRSHKRRSSLPDALANASIEIKQANKSSKKRGDDFGPPQLLSDVSPDPTISADPRLAVMLATLMTFLPRSLAARFLTVFTVSFQPYSGLTAPMQALLRSEACAMCLGSSPEGAEAHLVDEDDANMVAVLQCKQLGCKHVVHRSCLRDVHMVSRLLASHPLNRFRVMPPSRAMRSSELAVAQQSAARLYRQRRGSVTARDVQVGGTVPSLVMPPNIQQPLLQWRVQLHVTHLVGSQPASTVQWCQEVPPCMDSVTGMPFAVFTASRSRMNAFRLSRGVMSLTMSCQAGEDTYNWRVGGVFDLSQLQPAAGSAQGNTSQVSEVAGDKATAEIKSSSSPPSDSTENNSSAANDGKGGGPSNGSQTKLSGDSKEQTRRVGADLVLIGDAMSYSSRRFAGLHVTVEQLSPAVSGMVCSPNDSRAWWRVRRIRLDYPLRPKAKKRSSLGAGAGAGGAEEKKSISINVDEDDDVTSVDGVIVGHGRFEFGSLGMSPGSSFPTTPQSDQSGTFFSRFDRGGSSRNTGDNSPLSSMMSDRSGSSSLFSDEFAETVERSLAMRREMEENRRVEKMERITSAVTVLQNDEPRPALPYLAPTMPVSSLPSLPPSFHSTSSHAVQTPLRAAFTSSVSPSDELAARAPRTPPVAHPVAMAGATAHASHTTTTTAAAATLPPRAATAAAPVPATAAAAAMTDSKMSDARRTLANLIASEMTASERSSIGANGLSERGAGDEMMAQLVVLACSQHGSRALQHCLEPSRDPHLSHLVFASLFSALDQLMVDLFGNYLCQALVARVAPSERLCIIAQIASGIRAIACNRQGTRTLQALIEVLETDEEQQLMVGCLFSAIPPEINGFRLEVDPGTGSFVVPAATLAKLQSMITATPASTRAAHVLSLTRHLSGSHTLKSLALHCRVEFLVPMLKLVFDVSNPETAFLGLNQQGLWVLRPCVTRAPPELLIDYVEYVFKMVHNFSRSQYGNFCLQHVLQRVRTLLGPISAEPPGAVSDTAAGSTEVSWADSKGTDGKDSKSIGKHSAADESYTLSQELRARYEASFAILIQQLRGHFMSYSKQKFGSNVVEKCLLLGNWDMRMTVIDELLNPKTVAALLHDALGNYVMQCMLLVVPSSQYATLVSMIRAVLGSLRKAIRGKWLRLLRKNKRSGGNFGGGDFASEQHGGQTGHLPAGRQQQQQQQRQHQPQTGRPILPATTTAATAPAGMMMMPNMLSSGAVRLPTPGMGGQVLSPENAMMYLNQMQQAQAQAQLAVQMAQLQAAQYQAARVQSAAFSMQQQLQQQQQQPQQQQQQPQPAFYMSPDATSSLTAPAPVSMNWQQLSMFQQAAFAQQQQQQQHQQQQHQLMLQAQTAQAAQNWDFRQQPF